MTNVSILHSEVVKIYMRGIRAVSAFVASLTSVLLPSRSKVGWLGIALVAAFLLAACGGVADDEMEMVYDTEGEPMEDMPRGSKEVARSEDAAPDFQLVLFGNENHEAGEVIQLSQFQGQPVLVNFWFPSCPPCRAEMPDLERTSQDHKDDGLQLIGVQQIGLDTAQDGQDFIDETGITYAIGADSDGSIFADYRFTGFPTTFFLNRDHEIVRRWTGPLNHEKLEELVQEMLQ